MPEPVDEISVQAPAKINISLSVGPRRPDGYHDLQTVFHAVELYDVVRVGSAPALSLRIDGPESAGLSADSRNLAWRAACALGDKVGREPAVALRVTKNIPVAAGLAGGSADAAATLLALDRLWNLQLSLSELTELAAGLGSDVAFGLLGGTALGTGRGERLEALTDRSYHWVLALAQGELSTPAVFGTLDRMRADVDPPTPITTECVLDALSDGDPRVLATQLGNDLQPAALAMADYLQNTLATGVAHGALGGLVSGSGPTVVFLAEDAAAALRLAAGLEVSGCCRRALAVAGGARPLISTGPPALVSD